MRTIILSLLIASCFALTACDTSVNVAATANVGAQYTNVRITVKELWVNESATASIDDTTWLKFPASTPVTLDLVGLTGGTLNEFATQLKVPPGTYHQVRLFLADRTETLTSSAQTAGATYNDEVTYFDSNNVQSTVPLELANAAQGIGVETDLTVEAAGDAILAALASAPSTTDSTDLTSTTDPFATNPVTTTPTTTATTADTSTLGSGSTTTTVTGNALLVFDANRDLTEFLFSDQPGFLLNPSLSAYDERKVGTIQGQFDLSQLTINTGTARPDLQVTAEKLNDDSTRRVDVASAPITADGLFTLYPLPIDDSTSTTTYDLVIHGPTVRTTVIRQVPVTKGAPASGGDVALGTITLTVSDSYAANVATSTPVSPRGARVGFYQTLPDDSAPYLIEQQPIDPLSGELATNAALPNATTIVYGTFGTSFTLLAAAPQEGASKYSVAALAPFYGNGAFSNTLLAPSAGATDVAAFTVPDVPIPSTAASGTIAAVVSSATPGKYDKGALLVTHNGAVITTVPLDDALAGSATSTTVNVTGIPASGSSSFDRGLYYLEVWAWNSSNPTSTFTRQPLGTAVDLRSTVTANATVTIN
ncbi:MAG: DUF4382 domain-containing protein [Gammaproteobacteria bacterium]